MKSIILAFTVLYAICSGSVSFAETSSANRQYPGGADEQDLRVQTELADPTLKTDRKSFEQKIMQNIFKKNTTTAERDAKTSSATPARKPAPKPAKKN
jgi:hypothetical protein